MIPVLYEVPIEGISGSLAIAPRPRGGDRLIDELRGLQGLGIDTVVSLLTEPEALELGLTAEAEICHELGIAFRTLPILDMGTPADVAGADRLIVDLANGVRNGSRAAVHCRGSIGRSGLIVCGALIVLGAVPDDAMGRASAARGVAVPETEAQRDWLRRFAGRQGHRAV